MIHLTLRLAILALAATAPEAALAQADQILRNPDGTVVDPVLRYPDGTPVPATAQIFPLVPRDVSVTGTVLPALPYPQQDLSGRAARPGCETQSYVVGPNRRVRVHRC